MGVGFAHALQCIESIIGIMSDVQNKTDFFPAIGKVIRIELMDCVTRDYFHSKVVLFSGYQTLCQKWLKSANIGGEAFCPPGGIAFSRSGNKIKPYSQLIIEFGFL